MSSRQARRQTRRQRVKERSREAVARQQSGHPPLFSLHYRYRVVTPDFIETSSSETMIEARISANILARTRGERVFILDSRVPMIERYRIMETVYPLFLPWFERDEMPEKVNWQKEGF